MAGFTAELYLAHFNFNFSFNFGFSFNFNFIFSILALSFWALGPVLHSRTW